MGAAIYPLAAPIHRDGFTSQAVVFAGSSVGVLLDGAVEQEAARRCDLRPDKRHLLRASKIGFSRRLPDDQQTMKEWGLISIVTREGGALPGRTLLACEFVSNEDRKALEAFEKHKP